VGWEACAYAGPVLRGRVSWFERGDPWWRLDLEGVEDGALGVGRPCRPLDGAGLTLQGDEVQSLQVGGDPLPALAAGALGDPDQE
jgi:hypothetical protein